MPDNQEAFMRSAALLVALLLCMTPVAQADPGDAESGATAYARGDYETAYRFWKPLAEQGDADLQVRLGAMHEWGMGVAMSYREAVKWYRMAAEQGHPEALFNMGFMYGSGQGVEQDDVQAYAWFELAAEQGDDAAAEFRDVAAENLPPEQLAQARQLARELRRK
jgi:uncharacterized protein